MLRNFYFPLSQVRKEIFIVSTRKEKNFLLARMKICILIMSSQSKKMCTFKSWRKLSLMSHTSSLLPSRWTFYFYFMFRKNWKFVYFDYHHHQRKKEKFARGTYVRKRKQILKNDGWVKLEGRVMRWWQQDWKYLEMIISRYSASTAFFLCKQ